MDIRDLNALVREHNTPFHRLKEEMGKVIVGQKELFDKLLIALLSEGHILLEGIPGLAKTLTIATLAKTLECSFQRIQFTPDLLPADLTGTTIYHPQKQVFSTKKGPVFANIILSDEINRAPPKVQAALLEAMGERQVTIGNETFPLPAPFLVLATQNPIEQEGTYPLPEAQVDRFMMKICLNYPSREEEREIVRRMAIDSHVPEPKKVMEIAQLSEAKKILEEIYIDDKVVQYVLDVIEATRNPEKYHIDLQNLLDYGASPRATIAMVRAAKAHAFLLGRGFVTPHDVKTLVPDILRHRLILSYEAQAEEVSVNDVLQKILNTLPVP